MKKILFSISMLMLSCCVAFAQNDPKAVKAAQKKVKEAQRIIDLADGDLNQAMGLIDEAMKFEEVTSQPDVWNVAGNVQKKLYDKEAMNYYLSGQPNYTGPQPDMNKMFSYMYKVYEYYMKCDDVEKTAVDKKGRPIKVKYHDANKATLCNPQNRRIIISGGVEYFNDKNYPEALKYFAMYQNSTEHPLLAGDSAVINDTLLIDNAYYASLSCMQMKDYDNVLTYTPVVKQASKYARYGYEFAAAAYKAQGDTVKWIAELQEGVKKYPDYEYFVGNLLDYYNNSGKFNEALEFANSMVANDPNDSFMQYVKGYLCQNLQKYDLAIEAYKAAIAVKPDYSDALQNLGLLYIQKANEVSEKSTVTDVKSAQYKKEQEIIKNYYKEALPYYEKVRELNPNDKNKWLNSLYRIYYSLNMPEQLKEVEALLEQ